MDLVIISTPFPKVMSGADGRIVDRCASGRVTRKINAGIYRWKSLSTIDGSPLEYSWKWNTADEVPDVRYTVEAIGSLTGTSLDPLNQTSTKELLHELGRMIPSLDLTWFVHFATAFYDTDKENYVTEAGTPITTTMALAFEFLKKSLVVKAYFAPNKLGQTGPAGKVVHFLKTNSEGSLLQPFSSPSTVLSPASRA